MTKPVDPEGHTRIIALTCFVALASPFLFGYGTLPLTNFVAEIVSVVGFAMLLVLASQYGESRASTAELRNVGLAFGLLALTVAVQYLVFGRHNPVNWFFVFGYLMLAMMAAWVGYLANTRANGLRWLRGMTFAFVAGCAIASLAAIAQYFSIDGSGVLLSPVVQSGRTFGFIRQPNHQATFICLGVVALLALQALVGRTKAAWALLLLAPLFAFGIVSTGSRTGLLELGFVSAFAIPFMRRNGLGVWKAFYPLLCAALLWVCLYRLSQGGGAGFYGADKLAQTASEGVGLRAEAWRQTWQLILERPWFGWGLPHYAAAFFLSGGAAKAGIFMTHSHNGFLQLAFGFGIPVALVFIGLMTWVLLRLWRQALNTGGFFSFALIGCLLIHSQVEFPLWYTNFLLPACWALGWLCHGDAPANAAGVATTAGASAGAPRAVWRTWFVAMIGIGLFVMAASMNRDYYKVTPVFTPGLATDLEPRLEVARSGFWFRQYVDFLELYRGKVTPANYRQHLEQAATLGCVIYESWYQPNTVVALIFADRIDDAKWILHSYRRLEKQGRVGQFRQAITDANPPRGPEVLAWLDTKESAPRSATMFEKTCYDVKDAR